MWISEKMRFAVQYDDFDDDSYLLVTFSPSFKTSKSTSGVFNNVFYVVEQNVKIF